MEHKRSVVAAAAASTVLVVASTAFAATTIFGSHGSDKVGSFEPVEQVLKPAPVPRVQASRGTRVRSANTDTSVAQTDPARQPEQPGSPSAEPPQQQAETSSTAAEPVEPRVEQHDPTTSSTLPQVDSNRSDPTTSTTVANVPTTDDGGASDD